MSYVNGIANGLKATERKYSLNKTLRLRGPAGLFKDEVHHPFCWKLLENCNSNLSKCPIDLITFHRKGNGNNAQEIVTGSEDLMEEIYKKFPNLKDFKFSNTEADPIKKWSEPREFQADVKYAAILVETVLGFWKNMFEGKLRNIESISHDNSFLDFSPNNFMQRTLLARFQMNRTIPKHTQFIVKPVYMALNLLSNLGPVAGQIIENHNLSYIITSNNDPDKFYSCILITSKINLSDFQSSTRIFSINITNLPSRDDLWYFVEAIENEKTNPFKVFKEFSKPAFPDFDVLQKMRKAQGPLILEHPTKVSGAQLMLNYRLTQPFVVAIRICSNNLPAPGKVSKLRLIKLNNEEILIFWTDKFYKCRCIRTYEIYFSYNAKEFLKIETNHISNMFYQLKHTIPGCYKIRSIDMTGRVSQFSNAICYEK